MTARNGVQRFIQVGDRQGARNRLEHNRPERNALMFTSRLLGMGLLAASMIALGGCQSELQTENQLLLEENQALRAQLHDRNTALESANMTARERDMEAARLRRELEDSRQRPGMGAGQTGFEGISGVTGTYGAGEVTASIESDVLFDSGSANLKAGAKQSLDRVASVLNGQYSGRTIRIVGHTDTDPIRRSGHKSNHHLGFERAYAVREYLVSRGVSPNRVYLASFGPDRPAGTKPQSRRVEIVVVLNQ